MNDRLDAFKAHREKMNQRIFGLEHIGINRFFTLDNQAYKDGALDSKTKEICGLVASAVLRCNDCIDYHCIQCIKAGITNEQLYDALNIALIVGGSIVIPHLRHAVETIDMLRDNEKSIEC